MGTCVLESASKRIKKGHIEALLLPTPHSSRQQLTRKDK